MNWESIGNNIPSAIFLLILVCLKIWQMVRQRRHQEAMIEKVAESIIEEPERSKNPPIETVSN